VIKLFFNLAGKVDYDYHSHMLCERLCTKCPRKTTHQCTTSNYLRQLKKLDV